jgi:hypothetical protein
MLVIVTVAPAMIPPLGSVTVPTMAPDVVCALSESVTKQKHNNSLVK